MKMARKWREWSGAPSLQSTRRSSTKRFPDEWRLWVNLRGLELNINRFTIDLHSFLRPLMNLFSKCKDFYCEDSTTLSHVLAPSTVVIEPPPTLQRPVVASWQIHNITSQVTVGMTTDISETKRNIVATSGQKCHRDTRYMTRPSPTSWLPSTARRAANCIRNFRKLQRPNPLTKSSKKRHATPSRGPRHDYIEFESIPSLQHLVVMTSESSRWCFYNANRMHES